MIIIRFILLISLFVMVSGCALNNGGDPIPISSETDQETQNAAIKYLEQKYKKKFGIKKAIQSNLTGENTIIAYPKEDPDMRVYVFKKDQEFTDTYVSSTYTKEAITLIEPIADKYFKQAWDAHIRVVVDESLENTLVKDGQFPSFQKQLKDTPDNVKLFIDLSILRGNRENLKSDLEPISQYINELKQMGFKRVSLDIDCYDQKLTEEIPNPKPGEGEKTLPYLIYTFSTSFSEFQRIVEGKETNIEKFLYVREQ